LYNGDKGYSWGALIAVALAAGPTGLVRNADGSVTATTSAAHKAVLGELATVLSGSAGAGGTRFDGNYYIKAAPSATSLTLIPVDDVILHQAPDTGGGGNVSLIQMEQPAPGSAGKAFGLQRDAGGDFTPTQLYADGIFDGAPGVFEVDVEGAEIDHPNAYALMTGGAISVVNANNAFHAVITDQANFVRLTLKTRTNAVNFAGTVRA
jgi:hypothetical protein